MKKEFRASPSAIGTFLECQRKWAFRAIAEIVLPQPASAALGTETHSQLEKYLQGESLDFTKASGYIASSAVHLLPPPKTEGIELEKYFTFKGASGVTYHGYTDVIGPDSSVFPNRTYRGIPVTDKGVPVVSDHKTTGNIGLYAKTEEDLHTDPQGVIYAKAAFERFPDAKHVDLLWTYMSTKGPRTSKRVYLRVLKDDVEREFQKIELTAAEMAVIHKAGTAPNDLPPTPSQCKEYGGCPYSPAKGGPCRISTLNPENKKMSNATQNMLDELTGRLPPGEQPAPSALPAWMTAAVDPGPGKSPPPTVPVQDPLALLTTASPPLINPPGEAAPVSSAMSPPPEPQVEKPKRTRRTKAEMEAARAAEAVPYAALVPGPAQDALKTAEKPLLQIQEPPTSVIPAAEGFTLYIDCLPLKGPTSASAAEDLYEAAKQIVNKQCDVIDYRMLDFGKGAGAFVSTVMDLVDRRETPIDIILDSRTPEGSLTVAGLTSRAARVVRGMR